MSHSNVQSFKQNEQKTHVEKKDSMIIIEGPTKQLRPQTRGMINRKEVSRRGNREILQSNHYYIPQQNQNVVIDQFNLPVHLQKDDAVIKIIPFNEENNVSKKNFSKF